MNLNCINRQLSTPIYVPCLPVAHPWYRKTHRGQCTELSRWHTANLLLPISPVSSRKRGGVNATARQSCVRCNPQNSYCLLHYAVMAALAHTHLSTEAYTCSNSSLDSLTTEENTINNKSRKKIAFTSSGLYLFIALMLIFKNQYSPDLKIR